MARAPLRDGLPSRGHRPAGDGAARPAGGVPARGRRHVQPHDGGVHGGGRRLRLPPRGRRCRDARRWAWSPMRTARRCRSVPPPQRRSADPPWSSPARIRTAPGSRCTWSARTTTRPRSSEPEEPEPRDRRTRPQIAAKGLDGAAAAEALSYSAPAEDGSVTPPPARRPTTRTRASAATPRARADRVRSSRCATAGPAPLSLGLAHRLRITYPMAAFVWKRAHTIAAARRRSS